MKYVKSYIRFLVDNIEDFGEGFVYELQYELQRGLTDKELHEVGEAEKVIKKYLMKWEPKQNGN